MKNSNPQLEALLDAESAEILGGYTLFYTPEDSLSLPVGINYDIKYRMGSDAGVGRENDHS